VKLVAVLVLSQLAVEVGEIGPSSIHEGRLSRSDDGFDFRACGATEIHFVDGSFAIQDTLDQFIETQAQAESKSIYVRFHGEIIRGVDGLPERYAEVVRIKNLLLHSATMPARCK